MSAVEHWDRIYSTRSPRQVGWYAPHLGTSMKWIDELDLAADEPVIDIGGGASTLVDDLIDKGHRNITVLDISAQAIKMVRDRLGEKDATVTWLQGDVIDSELPLIKYRLWHDRAVFHFLTDSRQQQGYRDKLLEYLQPGGHIIMGCFNLDAPPQCSGLPVQRYDAELLSDRLGREFILKRNHNEIHHTPSGVQQAYLYCLFERAA